MHPDSAPSPRYLAQGTSELPALSISRTVREYVQVHRTGIVLATFRRSCYLELEGRIVALVAAELLNGPLNIVVEVSGTHSFLRFPLGSVATASPAGATINATLRITFDTAQTWVATLTPWAEVAEGLLRSNLRLARTVLLREAPQGSFAHFLPGANSTGSSDFDGALGVKARRALAVLAAGIRKRDLCALTDAARQLAGLGSGLTPSGDDVLVGTLLALAVSPRADTEPVRTGLLVAAAGRSTRISGAYLAAAAQGEASEMWHRLLAVLPENHPSVLTSAVRSVMAVGETSGADMLAGFLLTQEAMRA